MIRVKGRIEMNKVLFMNFSPNKNGNTYRIGEELLKNQSHDTMQMIDYKNLSIWPSI